MLPDRHEVLFRPEMKIGMPQEVESVPDAEFLYELNKHYTEPLWSRLDKNGKGKWVEVQEELEAEQRYQLANEWIRRTFQRNFPRGLVFSPSSATVFLAAKTSVNHERRQRS